MLVAAAASVVGSAPSFADVVMPPPPHPGDISMQLQQEINGRLGSQMKFRAHHAVSSIVVAGSYGIAATTGTSFNLLIRDQRGWKSWRTGTPRPLSGERKRIADVRSGGRLRRLSASAGRLERCWGPPKAAARKLSC